MRRRALEFMIGTDCPECGGKRLRRESLSVTFSGLDIMELSRLSLKSLAGMLRPFAEGNQKKNAKLEAAHPEKVIVMQRIAEDLCARLAVLLDLGLGYLSLERSTPTLSPGELQRLRLATQLYSNLFGVVYVLDEPSAGLHPADTQSLLRALDGLKAAGNSLFVVEHDLDVIRRADWIVDVGPEAGEGGGEVLYSGVPSGLVGVAASRTAPYLYSTGPFAAREPRKPAGWLSLRRIIRNNLNGLDADFPLGVFTTVTGVSGSGKSSLVSGALIDLVAQYLGQNMVLEAAEDEVAENAVPAVTEGRLTAGMDQIKRLVQVDQKPIGRTPRSNMATYTGLFDGVRRLFAATESARARHYDAGRFSFNVAKGRCGNCDGEGFVMVELLFLPSVYTPCPVCTGTRYNAETLEVKYKDCNIAEVLAMTVNEAWVFFEEDAAIHRTLTVLREVGLGYLRLGQPATELSGGEAQRIKLATELQRAQRGNTLYVLDEPTTGLHPSDTERLMVQLDGLVAAGNTVIVVEHEMRVVAGSDWVIDIGPGAGEDGGTIVAAGVPEAIAGDENSSTGPYLQAFLKGNS